MTDWSGGLPVLAEYRVSLSEMEEIDVMRLTSVLHQNSQTRPSSSSLNPGGTNGAPIGADSYRAGWTEMVIQGNQRDSRVFPFAGTSRDDAPSIDLREVDRSGLAKRISLQAIKR